MVNSITGSQNDMGAPGSSVGSAMLSTWAWKLDKDAPAWGQSRCKRKFLQLEAHMLRWSRTSPLGKDARSVDLRKAEWLSRSKCPGAPDDAIDFNISGRTYTFSIEEHDTWLTTLVSTVPAVALDDELRSLRGLITDRSESFERKKRGGLVSKLNTRFALSRPTRSIIC